MVAALDVLKNKLKEMVKMTVESILCRDYIDGEASDSISQNVSAVQEVFDLLRVEEQIGLMVSDLDLYKNLHVLSDLVSNGHTYSGCQN